MTITRHDTPAPALPATITAATRRCGGCNQTVAISAGKNFWRGTVRRWLCNTCLKNKR